MWAHTFEKFFEPDAFLKRFSVFENPLQHRSTINGIEQLCLRVIQGDSDFAQRIYAEGLRCDEIENFSALSWMKSISASQKTLHSIYAAGLLQEWQQKFQHRTSKRLSADALFALAVDGPIIVSMAPHMKDMLIECAATEIKKVCNWNARSAQEKFSKGASLLAAHINFQGQPQTSKIAHSALGAALGEIVLIDGGITTRSASDMIDILATLLPLRNGFKASHDVVPNYLHTAIERMMPMLRMVTLGNGEIANFARNKFLAPNLKSILQHDRVRAAPLNIAPYAGLARIEKGQSIIVADVFDLHLPLAISSATQDILSVSMQHDFVTELEEAKLMQTDDGDLLRVQAQGFMPLGRDIFVNTEGSDLRAEDNIPQNGSTEFRFGEKTKALQVSSEEITLVSPDRTRWSLKQRGGRFENSAVAGVFLLKPLRSSSPSIVNWALRKHP